MNLSNSTRVSLLCDAAVHKINAWTSQVSAVKLASGLILFLNSPPNGGMEGETVKEFISVIDHYAYSHV